MRILLTADLHYNIARSRRAAVDLAQRACAAGGDAIVLAGDSAGADLASLGECLDLFADFPGRRLLVPGNHGLWCRDGESSLDRYERMIPETAHAHGFDVLDHSPVTWGRVGLVGSIGWYDYSLRNRSLEIPLAFYRAKVSPGAAAYYEEYGHLVAAHRDRLTDRHMAIGARWMDGQRVRLGMSDEAFVGRLVAKLQTQLADLAPRVERIVAVLHHLPFAELVPSARPDKFAFAAAFLGSDRLGRVLRACPKVTDVYCGHSHWRAEANIGPLRVVNIGSTYTHKRLEIWEC